MSKGIFDKVTVIIPTFNRYPYLLRILNYYKSYNFPTRILILDSSDGLLDEDRFRGFLSNNKICYRKTNLDLTAKIVDGLRGVSTPYSVFCADDMFITPNGIRESLSFLENNPDFSVAQGYSIGFWLRHIKGDKQQFMYRPSYDLVSNTFFGPKERLVCHLSKYSPTFYGVTRTDLLKIIFEEAAKFTDNNRFTELLLSMLTLVYGKMKTLDVFYTARQALSESMSTRSKTLIGFIKDGTYGEKYAKFRECLARHLSIKANSDIKDAQQAVDKGMSVYLSGCLKSKEPMKNILIRKVKDILENSIFPDWIYAEIRSLYRKLFLIRQKRMDDLRSFMNTPLSKYYGEINNIHNHLLASLKEEGSYGC